MSQTQTDECKATLDHPPDAAVALTDDIVYTLNTSGEQTFLNPAGHAVLELANGAGIGRPWVSFVHEDDRPALQSAMRHVLSPGGDRVEVEARLVSLNGRVFRIAHRLRGLRSENGTVCAVLGIGRDVSELRRVEEQLQQSQKLETIGLLAGGIAHDFNNMLAAILGYTELMLEDKSPDDPDHRALSYIHASTERAAALVKQLLIFSRRSKTELKSVHVGSVIEETLQMLRRTLPKTIRIAAQGTDRGDQAMGDAGRLQQALMNLCLNARDAMPNGGELRIEVERTVVEAPAESQQTGALPTGTEERADLLRPGEYVRIRVQDTGEGMTREVLDHIWDPFFTTKVAGEGTGLGLAVVQGIVQSHHGRVLVESAAGRGTSFLMDIPAATGEQLDIMGSLAEPPGGSETILVVDDEPVLLDLLFDILQPKGYHVLAASTCSKALDFVDAVGDKIDLMISDNMMPDMTGRELAREVMDRRPGMKILVCSGYSPTRESEMGELSYVASYVQKPYQRRDLLTRVREALDG